MYHHHRDLEPLLLSSLQTKISNNHSLCHYFHYHSSPLSWHSCLVDAESWSVSPSRSGQWICCRIHSKFAAGYIVYQTISTKANFACTTESRWIWLEDHHPNCLVASKSCHLHQVGVRPTLLQLFLSNDFNLMFWRRECTLLLNEGISNVASSMEYFSSWCHTLSCHFDSSSNMVHLTFTVTGYTVHPDDIFVIHFSDDLQMLKMESWLTLGGAIITTNDDIAALHIFLCKHFSNHNISENLALLLGIEYIYIYINIYWNYYKLKF